MPNIVLQWMAFKQSVYNIARKVFASGAVIITRLVTGLRIPQMINITWCQKFYATILIRLKITWNLYFRKVISLRFSDSLAGTLCLCLQTVFSSIFSFITFSIFLTLHHLQCK